MPRLTNLFARDIVSALELVEDERVEFRRICSLLHVIDLGDDLPLVAVADEGEHVGELHCAELGVNRHDGGRGGLRADLTSQSCSSSGCMPWRRTSIRRRSSATEGRP